MITNNHIEELKKLVSALGIDNTIKRVLLILIEESKELTDGVQMSFPDYKGFIAPIIEEAQHAQTDLLIEPKKAINTFLRNSGSDFQLEVVGGDTGFKGNFDRKRDWIGFYLAEPRMGKNAREIPFDPLRIDGV